MAEIVELSSADASRWAAQLELTFERRLERTTVRRQHRGPLVIQRPFYPEHGVCHVVLIHPPGGVVGGDRLTLAAELRSRAQALVTTPGATRFYRSAGPTAEVEQRFELAPDAELEWLPQETIVFSGARAQTVTRVELAAGATFIGWDLVCLGRPASGEPFSQGLFSQRLELSRQGVPLLVERGRFAAQAPIATEAWGLDGQCVVGNLVATLGHHDLASNVRAVLSDDTVAVTQMRGVLVCRYLGPSARRARQLFQRAWQALRPELLGRAAVAPRIWAT